MTICIFVFDFSCLSSVVYRLCRSAFPKGAPMRSVRPLAVAMLVCGLVTAVDARAADTTALKCYRAKDALEMRGPTPDWLTLNEDNCRIGGSFRLVCQPST